MRGKSQNSCRGSYYVLLSQKIGRFHKMTGGSKPNILLWDPNHKMAAMEATMSSYPKALGSFTKWQKVPSQTSSYDGGSLWHVMGSSELFATENTLVGIHRQAPHWAHHSVLYLTSPMRSFIMQSPIVYKCRKQSTTVLKGLLEKHNCLLGS